MPGERWKHITLPNPKTVYWNLVPEAALLRWHSPNHVHHTLGCAPTKSTNPLKSITKRPISAPDQSDFDLGRICCACFNLKKQILWFFKFLKLPVSICLIQIQTYNHQHISFKRHVHHPKIKTLITQKVLTVKKAHHHLLTEEPTINGMPYDQ